MAAAYKDIVNFEQVVSELRASTPLTGAMTAVYRQAIAAGHGDAPKSAMIRLFEQMLGVEVRRP